MPTGICAHKQYKPSRGHNHPRMRYPVTTPELAAATDYGRMYARVRGGEPLVPSITTVIGQHANDLSGWHGYMAAKAALEDQRAYRATGSHGLKFAIIRDAASASERYRDAAAARGDRVHNYAEAVALRAMGREHNLDENREQLIINGEQAYADRFDEWWEAFKPRPLAAEGKCAWIVLLGAHSPSVRRRRAPWPRRSLLPVRVADVVLGEVASDHVVG